MKLTSLVNHMKYGQWPWEKGLQSQLGIWDGFTVGEGKGARRDVARASHPPSSFLSGVYPEDYPEDEYLSNENNKASNIWSKMEA